MTLRPPRSTRTDTRFPDTTLFRSTSRHRRNRPIHEHAMTKDQIIAEISDMQGQIQAAREELSHGPEIDLVDISGRIETTVTAIAVLDHEEALEVRPVLNGFLEDLQSFVRALESRIDELGEAGEIGRAHV